MPKRKILVIEDEETVRDNLASLLEEEFNVSQASSGQEGIEQAKTVLPDLIICDINMPCMTGYEVKEELNIAPVTRLIPFIFLTANVDRDQVRRGMALGADDYLTKPYRAKELLGAIEARLKKADEISEQIELEKSNVRSKLLRSIPDSLGVPLNSIIGSSQLLEEFIQEKLAGQEKIEALQYIRDVTSSAHQLYGTVWAYYRSLNRSKND